MAVARPTKEFILSEIRRLADETGKTPSKRAFEVATGVGEHIWSGRYWARWSEVIDEAGLAPNAWGAKVHDDVALCQLLADLTREVGRFPTKSEMGLKRRRDPEFPVSGVFDRLGRKEEQIQKVAAFAMSRPEYVDVASLLPKSVTTEPVAETTAVAGYVYLIKSGEFHKIGMTNHLGRRMFQIELQLPERAELVHHIETDDPRGIEAYWHNRFKESRANGEWFRLHAADIAAFKRRTYM